MIIQVCVERMLESPTYLVMAVTPVEEDNRLFFGTQVSSIFVEIPTKISQIFMFSDRGQSKH